VKELHLNGRSFDQLITLTPAFPMPLSNTLDSGAWNMFSVRESGRETNRFIINGIDWSDERDPASLLPRKERAGNCWAWKSCGIQCLNGHLRRRVWKTGRRSDQYRHVFGEQTKSRSVFEYLPQHELDAPAIIFDKPLRSSVQTQSIWRVSGRPAQKDKLFLFGTYEGSRSGYRVRAPRLCRAGVLARVFSRTRPARVLLLIEDARIGRCVQWRRFGRAGPSTPTAESHTLMHRRIRPTTGEHTRRPRRERPWRAHAPGTTEALERDNRSWNPS